MTALAETIRAQEAVLRGVLELKIESAAAKLEAADRIWLVGTGTSQHAAELGAQMLRRADVDARWESAAGFARPPSAPNPADALILISHTGETAFARNVRRQAVAANRSLVSITGIGVGWGEAIEVAPRERSETYTASYTAALLLLARLANAMGADEFDDAALQTTIAAVAEAADHSWEDLARPKRLLAIAGAGPAAVTAREGALKVREAARLLSEGFEAEYLLHGSAVPLGSDDSLLLLQPRDDPDGLLPAIGAAAREEGVAVHSVADTASLDPLLAQLPLTVRLQLLASSLADAGGYDPDAVLEGAWAEEGLWTRGA